MQGLAFVQTINNLYTGIFFGEFRLSKVILFLA